MQCVHQNNAVSFSFLSPSIPLYVMHIVRMSAEYADRSFVLVHSISEAHKTIAAAASPFHHQLYVPHSAECAKNSRWCDAMPLHSSIIPKRRGFVSNAPTMRIPRKAVFVCSCSWKWNKFVYEATRKNLATGQMVSVAKGYPTGKKTSTKSSLLISRFGRKPTFCRLTSHRFCIRSNSEIYNKNKFVCESNASNSIIRSTRTHNSYGKIRSFSRPHLTVIISLTQPVGKSYADYFLFRSWKAILTAQQTN